MVWLELTWVIANGLESKCNNNIVLDKKKVWDKKVCIIHNYFTNIKCCYHAVIFKRIGTHCTVYTLFCFYWLKIPLCSDRKKIKEILNWCEKWLRIVATKCNFKKVSSFNWSPLRSKLKLTKKIFIDRILTPQLLILTKFTLTTEEKKY